MASIFVEKLLVESGVECSLWIAFNMIYAFAACLPQVGTLQIKIHNTRDSFTLYNSKGLVTPVFIIGKIKSLQCNLCDQ